jgi:hypothetical protein
LSAAVSLEIDPGHQTIAEQERQDVTTPALLRGRDKDLEAITEL